MSDVAFDISGEMARWGHSAAREKATQYFVDTGLDGRGTRVEKQGQLRRMTEIHRKILRLSMSGMKNRDIAETLGLSEVSVSTTLNSNLIVQLRKTLQDEMDNALLESKRELAMASQLAVEVHRRILSGEVEVAPMDQFKVAQDLLDRTGMGKETKVSSTNRSLHLTSDDLAFLKDELVEDDVSIDIEGCEE